MVTAFAAAGFQTAIYLDAISALPALRMKTFSLALLGLDIHDTDPFAFCGEVSRIVPVITVLRAPDVSLCVRMRCRRLRDDTDRRTRPRRKSPQRAAAYVASAV